jgi:hypothetical protein
MNGRYASLLLIIAAFAAPCFAASDFRERLRVYIDGMSRQSLVAVATGYVPSDGNSGDGGWRVFERKGARFIASDSGDTLKRFGLPDSPQDLSPAAAVPPATTGFTSYRFDQDFALSYASPGAGRIAAAKSSEGKKQITMADAIGPLHFYILGSSGATLADLLDLAQNLKVSPEESGSLKLLVATGDTPFGTIRLVCREGDVVPVSCEITKTKGQFHNGQRIGDVPSKSDGRPTFDSIKLMLRWSELSQGTSYPVPLHSECIQQAFVAGKVISSTRLVVEARLLAGPEAKAVDFSPPNGTPLVFVHAPDGVQREWRGGSIQISSNQELTNRLDQLAAPGQIPQPESSAHGTDRLPTLVIAIAAVLLMLLGVAVFRHHVRRNRDAGKV